MNASSIYSADFDAIRAANPELAISLYALEPGGPVTLEVIAPDGFSSTWSAPTAQEALAMAFPEAAKPERLMCPNTGLPCVPGCGTDGCAGLNIPLNEWPTPDEPDEPPTSIFD